MLWLDVVWCVVWAWQPLSSSKCRSAYGCIGSRNLHMLVWTANAAGLETSPEVLTARALLSLNMFECQKHPKDHSAHHQIIYDNVIMAVGLKYSWVFFLPWAWWLVTCVHASVITAWLLHTQSVWADAEVCHGGYKVRRHWDWDTWNVWTLGMSRDKVWVQPRLVGLALTRMYPPLVTVRACHVSFKLHIHRTRNLAFALRAAVAIHICRWCSPLPQVQVVQVESSCNFYMTIYECVQFNR